jgi:antitoxin (DNA-binding transcriptional repressor) of toxin-antitoxin stability system
MSAISIQEAQATLPQLIHGLSPGEEIVITDNDRPVAKLMSAGPQLRKAPMLGTQPGTVLYMSPDFDAPLDDFKEYME